MSTHIAMSKNHSYELSNELFFYCPQMFYFGYEIIACKLSKVSSESAVLRTALTKWTLDLELF